MDKRPATAHGLKDATTDPDQIRAWWSRTPDANIGIPTGAVSGLVVIDVDNGQEGDLSLAKLEADHGPMPTTLVVVTPGDREDGKAPGRHIYVRHPGGKVKNSAGKLGPGLDVRGDGGYVVAPPSRRRGGHYLAEVDAPVQELRPPWHGLLRDGRKEPASSAPAPVEARDRFAKPGRTFTMAEAQDYVRPPLAALWDAQVGTINHRLNDAAMTLGHFVPAFWTEDQARELLTLGLTGTAYDGATWQAEDTIRSGLGAGMAEPYTLIEDQDQEPSRSRRVNLRPYLDGTYQPPEPTAGAVRSDGVRILYPAKWHTCIGLTGCGKSWLACWHAAHELAAAHVVVYLHFEEAGPAPTLDRFRSLGVDQDTLDARLVWLDTDEPWTAEDFAAELEELDPAPTLVVLDGINAACTLHGWPHEKPEGVGSYRETFVRPATRVDAAVLSLGHPVKDRTRQTERHGYGSGDWLNLVDGGGFRLEASGQPIHRGGSGASRLYPVKDRAGGVERHGTLNGAREAGWWFLGMFTISTMTSIGRDGARDVISAELVAPAKGQDQDGDELDELGDAIVAALAKRAGEYASKTRLAEMLRADKVEHSNDNLGPALDRLQERGRLERGPEPGTGKPWPGRLPRTGPEAGTDPEAVA
jgi:hypothetical protein